MSFLLFCYKMRVYKSKRVPLLLFSAVCDIFRKKIFFFENFKFFSKKNVLRFLSLRYSADFRRSRLVYIVCLDYVGRSRFHVDLLSACTHPMFLAYSKQQICIYYCFSVDILFFKNPILRVVFTNFGVSKSANGNSPICQNSTKNYSFLTQLIIQSS